MRRRDFSDEELNRVISLKRAGSSWVKIQRETGINRRTAKRAYDKWERSKSMEELKEARKDVAAQAFREHMDSLVTLATSLVTNLSVPFWRDDMEKNAEEFFSWLWDQDLLQRLVVPTISVGTNEAYAPVPRPRVLDPQSYRREKELLFESLKIHTREEVRWEDVLDNRWKKARDNCAKIVPKLRRETSEVVNNSVNQERQMNLLHSIKEAGGKDNPVKRMVEAVLEAIWRDILRDKLDLVQECSFFETVSLEHRMSEATYLMPGRETVLGFPRNPKISLAEKVTRICELAANNLRKGRTVRDLHHEVYNMKKASEELREMLNPVKLRPMILRTRCDLCPA